MAFFSLRKSSLTFLALITVGAGLMPCARAQTPLVTIERVQIGDAGNAADTNNYGAVSNRYAIGKYEVTIAQYATFLNAVAATDSKNLYNTNMASNLKIAGIARSGGSGSYSNSLVISEGGTVESAQSAIGLTSTASNNSALVTGTGSVWTNSGDLYVGADGNSNSLVISEGGRVANGIGTIGFTSTSSNNSVLITGTGSVWTNTGDLVVGYEGSGNSLVISNGGIVAVDSNSGIGVIATSSNNAVLVTGTNSLWTNSSDIYVGYTGSSNSLVISDGGEVFVGTNLVISELAGSSNNSVSISGGSLTVTNGQIDIGKAGSGTLEVTGGTVTVKELLATNGANSVITFNGGTIISEGTTIDSETGFIIGDTGSGATFIANGGTHNIVTTNPSIFPALIVGNSGSSNSLVISNGGTVQSSLLVLGGLPFDAEPSTTSSNNSMLVAGEGSGWAGIAIAVGFSSSGNSLVISNGGTLANDFGDIGVFDTSFNNSALVTGTNSLWTNRGDFNVGVSGTGNTLTLADGGTLAASSLIIAASNASSGTLNIGRFGTNDTAGTIIAPTIAFGEGKGAINFNQSDATTITAVISGNGALSQLGAGTTTLSASNTYTGATTVAAGRLVVDGSIAASAVTVQSGGELSGSGAVGAISGAGSIDPGNSPGIFTAASLDPSGGLSFNFEFTSLNPTYSNASASVNDVLRLTDATPFVASLTGVNTVNVYFNVDLFEEGQTYTGGFFTDPQLDFLAEIVDGSFNYYVKDAGGSVNYGGETYSALGAGLAIELTTASQSGDFAGGTVNGQISQFEVVPEPSTYALLAVVIAGFGVRLLRRKLPEFFNISPERTGARGRSRQSGTRRAT